MMKFISYCAVLLALLTSSCERSPPSSSKPVVLVSVPPYLYFVKRIAKDTVKVDSLIPVGVNPHMYEPTPKQVQQFREAVLWIRLAEPSEKKTYKVLVEQSRQMQIVDLTQNMALLPLCAEEIAACHEVGKDTHIWLSLRLAQEQAKIIAAHLCRLFPEHAEMYQKELDSFLLDLKELDHKISQLLSPKQGTAILVSHPAFAYFCRDYHLRQLSIETAGKEPLPQDITHILKMAKEYKVTSVIIEPQYSDKGAQLIAQCLKVPVYEIDPYADDYLRNIQSIAEVIVR